MTDFVQVLANSTHATRAGTCTLDFETRLASDDSGTFTGHAAIFDETNSHNEIVKRGAFTRSIADHQARDRKPLMLWSHDPADIIGVWDSVREDSTGLAVSGRLILDSTRGRDAHALLKAGAVTGLSIGFRAKNSTRNAKGVRVLSDVDLVEISLVGLPSAGNARVTSVRSVDAFHRAVASAIATLRGNPNV
jgi:HK97 family phage prohead protease